MPKLARRPAQRYQISEVRDHPGEPIWRCSHAFAREKGSPLWRPCRRELVAQSRGRIDGQCSFAPLRRASHSVRKNGLAQFESLSDQPEIIEILDPTIGYAKRGQRLEFFRYNRFDGVCPKMRRRAFSKTG